MPKDILVKEEFKEPDDVSNISEISNNNFNTIPNQQASNAQNVTQPVQQSMNYQIVQPMNQGTQNVAPMANNAIPSVQQPVTFQNKSTQINGNISQ